MIKNLTYWRRYFLSAFIRFNKKIYKHFNILSSRQFFHLKIYITYFLLEIPPPPEYEEKIEKRWKKIKEMKKIRVETFQILGDNNRGLCSPANKIPKSCPSPWFLNTLLVSFNLKVWMSSQVILLNYTAGLKLTVVCIIVKPFKNIIFINRWSYKSFFVLKQSTLSLKHYFLLAIFGYVMVLI